MVPLIVLLASFVLFALVGAAGAHPFTPWPAALRWALLAMFLLTASAHFTKTRVDLMRMVPRAFPNPGLLVTLTGFLELAGALGLLYPATRPLAALGLIALLVAMFPANAHAARAGLTLRGKPSTPLVPRLAIQFVFVVAIALAGFVPG
jgi:uncharacterized membrane protein